MKKPVKFIVVEGIDRSGKSTFCKKMKDIFNKNLPNKSVLSMRYPDRSTQAGKLLDEYLQKKK